MLMKLCKLSPEMQERVAREAANGESRDKEVVEPDINLLASELVRDIESASRKEKLTAVVQSRERLNPAKVIILTRGCCCWWSHPHSGSFLVSAACREMSKRGKNVIVGYADPRANERGRIFSACNFLFCATTNPTEKFRTRDGKVYDARNVHLLTRDRTGGTLKYKRSRAEQKQLLIEEGCEFFKDDVRKLRFVGIYGDRRTKRILRSALKWPVLPSPKNQQASEGCREEDGGGDYGLHGGGEGSVEGVGSLL
jgi:hypothetical protein